jgi:FkbM family methyltransferase
MNLLRVFQPAAWRRRYGMVRTNLNIRMRDLMLKRLDLNRELKSGLRVDVASWGDWTIFTDIFVECEYDPALRAALALSRRGDSLNILDLGANVGFFAFRAGHLLLGATPPLTDFRITCVEGSLKVYAELTRRLQASLALQKRTRTVHGLVGLRSGQASLTSLPFHPMNAVSNQAGNDAIPYVDVESLLEPGSRVHLIKCDIEGSEGDFIENYPRLLERTELAIFEFHHNKCDVAKCGEQLKRCGLVHRKILAGGEFTSVEMFSRFAINE